MVRSVSRLLTVGYIIACLATAVAGHRRAIGQDTAEPLVGAIADVLVVDGGPPAIAIAFADVPTALAQELAVGDVLGVFDDKGTKIAELRLERIGSADDAEGGVVRVSGSLVGVAAGDDATTDPRRVLTGDRVARADALEPEAADGTGGPLVVGSVLIVRLVDEQLVAIADLPAEAAVEIGEIWYVLASDGDWVAEAEIAVKVESEAPEGRVRYAVRLTLRSSTDAVYVGDRIANRDRLPALEQEPEAGTVTARVIRFETDGDGWATILEVPEEQVDVIKVGDTLTGFRPEKSTEPVATLTILFIAEPGDADSPRRIAGRVEPLPDVQLSAPGVLVFTNGDALPASEDDDGQ